MKIRLNINLFFLLLLALQGCASLQIHSFVRRSERDPGHVACYRELDRVVKEAKVRNDADFSVKGFPYLRGNRFLVALKARIQTPQQRDLWIKELQKLDLSARAKELKNLPESSFLEFTQRTGLNPSRDEVFQHLKEYSDQFFKADERQSKFLRTLKLAVQNRSEYDWIMRTAGLYPIYSLPVLGATVIVYNEYRAWHQEPIEKLPVLGELITYVPQQESKSGYRKEASDVIRSAPRDALDVPEFSIRDLNEIAIAFAPIFIQDTAENFDRFGEVEWKDNKVMIATKKPTVYHYPGYAIIKDQPVLQMNYALWYTERAGANAPWIEHGPLDGLTVRVTFDADGTPAAVDIMNSCGCYYFAVPNADKVAGVKSKAWALDPLVPAWLPKDFPERPLFLRINSGWHQTQKIYTDEAPSNAKTYELIPYDILEQLPHADGLTESVFNNIGIMKNSSRIEPVIFFPTGIYDIGYMRQRGHHAIKLIGQAHFSDPYLLEKDLIFK